MKSLCLVGLLLSLSATTYAGSRNICDDLIDNGAPKASIERCWETHGKSEHYLSNQQDLLRDAEDREEDDRRERQQREEEETRLRRLREAISEKKFTFLDLKEKGFGLPYIAKQTTYEYDSRGYIDGQDDEMLTSGTEMCKYLGYEKAKLVTINKKGVSSRNAKGQALYIDTKNPLFGSKKYVQKVFKSNKTGRKVYYFQSITCVRSRIADNEIMDHVSEVISYLEADLQTGAPIRRTNTRVNDRSRGSSDDANDDYEDEGDNGDFIYTPNGSSR